MPNAHGKVVDTTHLSLEHAEEHLYFHRDYIAHLYRWTHALRTLPRLYARAKQPVHILDIGCGKEQPLVKALYARGMNAWVGSYTGVDVRPKLTLDPIAAKIKQYPVKVISKDAAKLKDADLPAPPGLITCFEMVEHVEPAHALRVVKKLRQLAAPGATMLLSTPCFNGKQAGNHVNELTYQECGALLERGGWHVDRAYGTFASQRDYVDELTKRYGHGARQLFELLHEYYYGCQLATMFAPAFPELSRNCLWHCSTDTGPRQFKAHRKPTAVQTPTLF